MCRHVRMQAHEHTHTKEQNTDKIFQSINILITIPQHCTITCTRQLSDPILFCFTFIFLTCTKTDKRFIMCTVCTTGWIHKTMLY